MKTDGGDFFGEGTYGCTFSPPPQCSGQQTSIAPLPKKKGQILAKVFRDIDDLDEEWRFAKQIAKIDPKQRVFIYSAARCATSSKNVRKDRQASECSIVNQAPDNATLHMALMKKGGVTIEEFALSKGGISLKEFIFAVLPIIDGIDMLIKNKIVHHDLKFNNILYDPKTRVTNIIDFGLMIPMTGAFNKRLNPYLFSNYWLHPPEYRIAQYAYEHYRSGPSTEECYAVARDAIATLDVYFDNRTKETIKSGITQYTFQSEYEYEEAFVHFMSSVFNRRKGKAALDYLAKYANKIDIYSLGIMMVFLSSYLKFRDTNERKEFMSVVKFFVHPDPRKRPSPKKAVIMLKGVLSMR